MKRSWVFALLLLLAPIEGRADILGRLISANFNTTADQTITIAQGNRYVIRKIIVTNCSTSITLAAGGIYTGAGKTGTTIVLAAQVYTALTGSTKFLDLTLAAGITGDYLTSALVFLALTTGQGSAATCDVYLIGDSLS